MPYHASIIKDFAYAMSSIIPLVQARYMAKPNTPGTKKLILPTKRDYKSHGKGCGRVIL